MESITAKKKFCCDLHRVYWNREKSVVELAKGKVTEVSAERTEISFTKEQHQKAKTAAIKHYDYSAMPSNLTYSGREAWKAKARLEQNNS